MKKICLTLVGMYLMLLHAMGQLDSPDSSLYIAKPLRVEEVHLVSSYYTQNGDHSAVTGGIGTERVVDLSNGIELNFVGTDALKRKHTLVAGLGFDAHSSASAAHVSSTGASRTSGTRVYPSLDWTMEDARTGTSLGFGLYLSKEYNYSSVGIDGSFSKKNHNNGEFSVKMSGYFDRVRMIYPSELVQSIVTVTSASTGGFSKAKIPSRPRVTGDLSLSFSQVINQRLQGSVMLDAVGQGGYLGLPFHRVYFQDGSPAVELLPSERFKLPLGFRLNYFLGDNLIIRSYYRYYTDSWGVRAQTASLEIPWKITPFFSIAPFYRYYEQSASRYFAPYQQHTEADVYYTSNYEYAAFSSGYFGVNFRLAPPKGVASTLRTVELRYGHYSQTTGLHADLVSIDLDFK